MMLCYSLTSNNIKANNNVGVTSNNSATNKRKNVLMANFMNLKLILRALPSRFSLALLQRHSFQVSISMFMLHFIAFMEHTNKYHTRLSNIYTGK